MKESPLLEAALHYHAHGLPVVPVGPDKKACATWGHWRKQKQTEREVRGYGWEKLHGLALLTWPGSDCVVLDFDGPHARQTWEEQQGIPLPETATNRTQSGGTHLIYRVPEGIPRPGVGNGRDPRRKVRLVSAPACGCKKPCGVDLLLNGYFIVPPTPGYSEDPDYPFEPGQLATIPPAVLALARGQGTPPERGPEAPGDDWFAAAFRGPVPEGQRNDTATRLAGVFLARGHGVEQTLAILEPWARTACVPPMDRSELRATVQSVARLEAAKQRVPGPGEGRFTQPLSSLLAEPDEPVVFLVDRLLVAGANGWIGGEPKSLKSWLALYLALCIARGVPVFGKYPVPERARVLYLQEEDGRRRVRRRILKILTGANSPAPDDAFFRQSIKRGVLLDDDRWVDALRTELAEYRPALVVADVFELMHTKDSTERAELKPVFYTLSRLQEEFGCGFVLVDHFKKSALGSSKRGGQRLSGTVGKHAWGESSLYLFPGPRKNTVLVETELKDAPSEAFTLTLADTEDGGVIFEWAAEADAKADQMKAKMLEAVETAGGRAEWVTTKAVAEAAGVSSNTAGKWLVLLLDEDQKVERERRQVGKTTRVEWKLRA